MVVGYHPVTKLFNESISSISFLKLADHQYPFASCSSTSEPLEHIFDFFNGVHTLNDSFTVTWYWCWQTCCDN